MGSAITSEGQWVYSTRLAMPDGSQPRLATVDFSEKASLIALTVAHHCSGWNWGDGRPLASLCAAPAGGDPATAANADASIMKDSANLVAGKNLLGTFHHPRVVLIDPGC
jgi:hypothetical protein